MKRIFCLLSLFIIFGQCAFSDIVDKIENQRQDCFSKNYKSDYNMAKCNYDAIEKCNKEIKKVLKKIKNNTTEHQYSSLLTSQSAWNNFREQNNRALSDILENKIYFEPFLVSSNMKYLNVKYRLQELKVIEDYLKN